MHAWVDLLHGQAVTFLSPAWAFLCLCVVILLLWVSYSSLSLTLPGKRFPSTVPPTELTQEGQRQPWPSQKTPEAVLMHAGSS